MPRSRTYQLSASLVASSVGAGVMCLAAEGLGRSYRLHERRPDASFNLCARRLAGGRVEWRADLPSGAAHVIAPVAPTPALIRVDMIGPLEQRAGYHDPCGGWTDGHDAVAERLCAAFEQGDVLLVVDCPGGAAAGLQQGIDRALKSKAKHGRRVTVWANEMIGSAAMWWACAVGDELFLPAMAQIGSIGARGQHNSIAGALEKEGVKVTYFADPPDKIAFAPELPLSPVAEARGNRDVKLAADAFRAAVVGSPLGQRRGLTAESLVELGADMLTGEAAVDAGLADGVATEDEVVAYALKMAERGGEKTSSAQARARGGTMRIRTEEGGGENARRARAGDDEKMRRAEGEEPAAENGEEQGAAQEHDEEPPPSKPGDRTEGECAKCGEENGKEARYCAQCGEPLPEMEPTEPAAQEHDEEPPPSSKPIAPRGGSARRMSSTSSLAEILGVPADASLPVQKSAALDLRQIRDHAAKLTGQRSAAGILGGLTALASDAAESGRLRADLSAARRKQARAERWQLARRLVALGVPGHERGKVFLDDVDEAGNRKLVDGKPAVKLAPVYAEMKLGTLRGLVAGFERNAVPRSPFEPDRAAAEASARSGGHGDRATRIERAKSHPKVVEMSRRPGQTVSLDALAASFVDQNFDLPGA